MVINRRRWWLVALLVVAGAFLLTRSHRFDVSGMTALPDGLRYKDLRVGSGPQPKTGDLVTVQYSGRLPSGKLFDRSDAYQFTLGDGRRIPGWDEGIATMREGGERLMEIPPALGYGDHPPPDSSIPPGSTLLFDIIMSKVEPPRPSPSPSH